jgi:hypothetical protein
VHYVAEAVAAGVAVLKHGGQVALTLEPLLLDLLKLLWPLSEGAKFRQFFGLRSRR